MKPIEVGCLVLVINGYNVGHSGTVVGHDPNDIGGFVWLVDLGECVGRHRGGHKTIQTNEPIWHQSCDIIRIDDYDPSTEETTSDREVTV